MQNTLKNHIRVIDEGAARQYIDARAVFTALEDAKRRATEVRGGMFWKTQNGTDYLIRTTARGKQKSLGKRSEQNEAIYREFQERKQRIESRVADLREALDLHRKLNKAHRVGRVPEALVLFLDKLAATVDADRYIIIGPYSLYAYEAAAGIRIAAVDALDNLYNILYDIVMINRPGTLRDKENFSAIIVSKSGRMARMHTISPSYFMKYNQWFAEHARDRNLSLGEDILPAGLIEEMVEEYFPQLLNLGR